MQTSSQSAREHNFTTGHTSLFVELSGSIQQKQIRPRKTVLIGGLLVALVMLCFSPVLIAQVLLGSATGLVQDSTGAVIPGAAVSIVSPSTGFTR